VALRTEWDTATDAREFLEAARARFARTHGRARTLHGADLYGRAPWNVALVARDDAVTLVAGDDAGRFTEVLAAEAR
jgi:hypothetical protein